MFAVRVCLDCESEGHGSIGKLLLPQKLYHFLEGVLNHIFGQDHPGPSHRAVPSAGWRCPSGALRSYISYA